MKTEIRNSISGLLLIPLMLACCALLPRVQAVTPKMLTASPDEAVVGFNTRDGFNALISLTTGSFNTAIGFAALKLDTSGSHNTGVGAQALLNNTLGSFNTAIGENAMVFNIDGTQNMALGQGALANNLHGDNNTAMGFQALNANIVDDNTAVGWRALAANTIGDSNVAIGPEALFSNIEGSDNVAVGFQALVSNTGSLNTAVGSTALLSNTDGNFNTAVGHNALRQCTGSGNIALGIFAGTNITTGFNNIDIGSGGVGGESSTIRIGSSNHTATFIGGIFGASVNGASDVDVIIDNTGKLGTTTSSQRFKKDIKPMDQASEAILSLKPVTFHYKNDNTSTARFGLIAEDVAEVNPDLVVRDEKGEIYSVRYEAVNAMLLNEFLKARRQIDAQQKQIDALTVGLQKVSAQVEASKAVPQVVKNNR